MAEEHKKIVGNQSKMRSLYTQLKANAQDIDWGTEDEFMDGMSDPDAREWVHGTLSKRGLFSDDYDLDTFNKKLGFGVINLSDDTETGTGPVKSQQTTDNRQWQAQSGQQQYMTSQTQEQAGQDDVRQPQPPRYPVAQDETSINDPVMPMYKGYQPASPTVDFRQQSSDNSQQPIQTAVPLTEEAGAANGEAIRKSMEQKAQHNSAVRDINQAVQSGEDLKHMDDPYAAKVSELENEQGTQIIKDQEVKKRDMDTQQRANAAAAYVWDYLIKDNISTKLMPGVGQWGGNTLIAEGPAKRFMEIFTAEQQISDVTSRMNDSEMSAYARAAYGVDWGSLTADQKVGLREDLKGLIYPYALEELIQRSAPKTSVDMFMRTVRRGFMPNQLVDVGVGLWGSDAERLFKQIDDQAMDIAGHEYDKTWGGKLVTSSAEGTAFGLNMLLLGGVMTKGIAGALGRFTPQIASSLWAPGQAAARFAIYDAAVNNVYWNGLMRGCASMASQYVGFGRLGAINSGIAMLQDPNLANRYGKLTSMSGWLSELGCDAVRMVDAYNEEGVTGFKFGAVSMLTGGLISGAQGRVYGKAIKSGKGAYEASAEVASSKLVKGAKLGGLVGELGFFGGNEIAQINEMNRNNPDGQIGIADYEKWSTVMVGQIGFLGALKAVNAGHAHPDQYKMVAEHGKKWAEFSKKFLDDQGMRLNQDDIDEIAYAGIGRFNGFDLDLMNALMRTDAESGLTVYEKIMREQKLPVMTLFKLKLGMEHKVSVMGYKANRYGSVVPILSPKEFITTAVVVPSPSKSGGFRVATLGQHDEILEHKTFRTKEDAEAYAADCNRMAAQNEAHTLEAQLGDTMTTVKDVLHKWADEHGVGRIDAEDLYSEYLSERDYASPQAQELAESVKKEMWTLVSKNRMQAIAKCRQQVKTETGIDVNSVLYKEPWKISDEEREAVEKYNQMLATVKRTATTDPDILAVERALDPATGMVREGVTKDGREVTVKGSGETVVVTEKADPANGKPAGKPEMVKATDVEVTSETPAEELIENINERIREAQRKLEEIEKTNDELKALSKKEEKAIADAERELEGEQPESAEKPVNLAPEDAPVTVTPAEEAPVKEVPVDDAEPVRKASVYDADRGEWYDGEDVGAGMQVGTRRIKMSDGRIIDADVQDVKYIDEGQQTTDNRQQTAPEGQRTTDNGQPVATAPATEEGGVKVDNNGMPTMDNDPMVTASYLMNDPDLADMGEQLIKQRRDNANKAYEASLKKQPKLGSDSNVNRIKQERLAIKAEQERLKAVADYWNAVGEQADAIKNKKKQEAKDAAMMENRASQTTGAKLNRRIEKVVNEIGDPSTVREAVLMDFLKPGGFGVSKEDLVKELGAAGENLTAEGLKYQLARGERKQLGNTIQSIAEGIASEHGWDVQEVRDEIIRTLTEFSGDKAKAVEELEHIADVISGRKGQYTAEEAERMRQQAVENGEDLNAKPEVPEIPADLRPSNNEAPFDIEEGGEPMESPEGKAVKDGDTLGAKNVKSTTESRVKTIEADADVDLNEGDAMEKIYKINGHLNRAQGEAIEEAMSVLENGQKLPGQNMHPIAFIDPRTIVGKDHFGGNVPEAHIYKRQQERLHPLYEAYIKMIDKQIAKTKSAEIKEQLKMLRDSVQRKMEQVDRSIDPDYDAYKEYWSKNRAFDIEPETAEQMKEKMKQQEQPEKKDAELSIHSTFGDYRRAAEKIAKDENLSNDEKVKKIADLSRKWVKIENEKLDRAAKSCGVDADFLRRFGKATGIDVMAEEGMFRNTAENGIYDYDEMTGRATIYVNPRGNAMNNLGGILGHEGMHGLELTDGYDIVSEVLLDMEYSGGDLEGAIRSIQDRYNSHFDAMYRAGKGPRRHLYWEQAKKEVVADVLKNSIFAGKEGAERLRQAVDRIENNSIGAKFAAKMRDMYDLAVTAWNDGWAKTVEKKALMDARDMFADMYIKRRDVNNRRAMEDKSIIDYRGDEVAYIDDHNNIQFTLSTYDGYTDNLGIRHEGTRARMESYLNDKVEANLMTKEQKDAMLKKMDYWYDYMSKVADFKNEDGTFSFEAFREWNKKQPAYRLIGPEVEEKVLSTIVQNGEYPVNLELTTDCIKRETFTQLLNQIVKMNPTALRNMNPKEITIIQDMMKSYGIQTACPLCFVEGKRLMIRNWAQTIADNYNVALAKTLEKSDLLGGWKPKYKTVTENVDGKKKTRTYVENIDEMEEILGSFGFAKDDMVSEENWDTVKARKNQSEMKEYHRRINSTFELLSGKKGGVENDDLKDLEAAAKEASDKMLEMENQWRQEHPDEEWVMTKKQQEEIEKVLAAGKDKVNEKMMAAVLQFKELRHVLKAEDMMGSTGLDALRSKGDKAHRKLFSLMLSSFGAGTPKVVQRAEPYAGEIMDRNMDNAVNKAKKEGGWRLFSFSDFDVTKTFDIMQIFWDAEAREAKLQSYSKEVPYILFFGRNTNAKINMSTLVEVRPSADMLAAYAAAPNTSKDPNKLTKAKIKKQIEEYAGLVLDKDGKIIGMTWSGSHSVSPEFAQAIFHDNGYNANCGATTVGVSVNHTLYSMMTPWIRQVIPFHLSGMPIAARIRTDVGWYRDATKDQNTCIWKPANGNKSNVPGEGKGEWVSLHSDYAEEKLGKGFKDFNFYEGEENESWDLRNRCGDYANWCKENGLRVKFEWALNADNYVKWCKENGYEPNKQIEDEMRAHETDYNGIKIYDNYYKVIADFNPYQPVFNSKGDYVGDVKAPHKPIKGDFIDDQATLDLIFGSENSMLSNRENNIKHGNAMITKLANNAIAYLKGEKTAEEIMADDPEAFRNTEDAQLYLSRVNRQWSIDDAEAAGHPRSRNFKRWFGDWDTDPNNSSKVTDFDGKPLQVEHSTNGEYDYFDKDKIGSNSGDMGLFGAGFYFGDKGNTGIYGKNTKRFYLNIRKPLQFADSIPGNVFQELEYIFPVEMRDLVINNGYGNKKTIAEYIEIYNTVKNEMQEGMLDDAIKEKSQYMGKNAAKNEALIDRMYEYGASSLPSSMAALITNYIEGGSEAFRDAAIKAGRDGIIVYRGEDWHEYVAFEPEQIKSVDNNGDFNPNDKRIKYSMSENGGEVMESVPAGEPAGTGDVDYVNSKFNDDIDNTTNENIDNKIYRLGMPSEILKEAGIQDKEMILYGNKLRMKLAKHGFDISEIKDLPKVLRDPIAVFNNYKEDNNRGVLVELRTVDGNFLVGVAFGKGNNINLNIISSVFGKKDTSIDSWLRSGVATYINKKKVHEFMFRHPAPIAGTASNSELNSGANISVFDQINKYFGEKLYIRTKNFMNFFGNWEKNPEKSSKVIDENGEPLVMIHTTPNSFEAFDKNRINRSGNGNYIGNGFNFASHKTNYGENEIKVYLNARNPLRSDRLTLTEDDVVSIIKELDSTLYDGIIRDENRNILRSGDEGYEEALIDKVKAELRFKKNDASIYQWISGFHFEAEDVINAFKKRGFDSSINYGKDGRIETAVVFDPEQIKSADENNGDFNTNDQRYKYSIEGEGEAMTDVDDDQPVDNENLNRFESVDKNIRFNDIVGRKIVGYRYGKAPESGLSYNRQTNNYESGVSMAQVGFLKPVGSFAANGEKKYYYEGTISSETGGDDEICLNNVVQITKEEYESLRYEYAETSNAIANAYANRKLYLLSRGYRVGSESEIEQYRNSNLVNINNRRSYSIEGEGEDMEAEAGEPVDYVKDAAQQQFEQYRELVEGIEKEAANFQRELDFIKNGGTDKGLVTRVRMFVRNRLNLMTGTGLGPAGINNLLTQLDRARTATDIEPILGQIQYTLNKAEMKSEMDEMLRLLNTKTQSQTQKGLVKGVGVDSQTNQVLEDIRGSFRQMINTDIDERIREVNREIRSLKEEYGIKKVEEGNEEFQQRYRDLRERYTKLVEQKSEAVKVNAMETEEELNERHANILDEMNDYREKGKEIPVTLIEERIALPIRKQLAHLRSNMSQMEDAEKELAMEMDKLVGMTGDERKQQKELINDKRNALVNWQRRCVLASKQISDELKDLLETGKSKRAEAIKRQIEEESKLIFAALDAVKKEPVKQRNTPAGTVEHENKDWTKTEKFVASLQERWQAGRDKRKKYTHMYNAPGYCFNFLLKYLDKNHGQGDGPLYRMLMKDKGGAVEANDNYAEGMESFGKTVEAKVKELFGCDMNKLMADSKERTYITINTQVQDDSGMPYTRPVELTKGQALYIWLASRQTDGMEKLKSDGWGVPELYKIEEMLGEKYLKLGKWITDEFLPQLRADKYNPTYERLYGTSMHAAAHYFPIKIWDKVLHEKGELGEVFEGMPSAATGNLIMRKKNNLPIDTEVNALEELMAYGKKMERWNAMAELTQKLNTLLHCNAFRNRIEANEGKEMWQMWKDACMVVTGSYQAKEGNNTAKFMSKLQSSFMKNAIGFRWYTAMKQTLSYPAFMAYTGNLRFQAELLANIGRTFGTRKSDAWHESNFNWAMEHLPGFRQRVADGDMGIEGLNDDGIGGKIERKWSKWGMAANKWVDARTVAAGARAVYNYEYRRGIENGLSEKEAKRMATINAEICFNESQQSSRPEFSSPTQKNRDLYSRSTVAFQNSNISYRRGVLEGVNDILNAHNIYKNTIDDPRCTEEMKKQAKAEMKKQYTRGVRKVLNFGALLPGLWYWGSNLSVSWANSEEDEEDDKYWTNLIANIAMGSLTNGSSFGTMTQTLYNTVYKFMTGNSQSATADMNPLQSYALLGEIIKDAMTTYREDEKTEGGIGISGWAQGMANWGMRFVGVNPETWTNMYIGFANAAKRGKVELQDAMFVLNLPGSQRKAIVERMAREDSPADFMRQVEEAGKLYESEDDIRYGKLLAGTKLLTDTKRNEIVMDYINAKRPDFVELQEELKAFDKAVQTKYTEMKDAMIARGETGIEELVKLDAMEEVANSGEFNINLDDYKRYRSNYVRDDHGGLDLIEERTLSGVVRKPQSLKQKYENVLKECKKAAADVDNNPEEFNRLVYEVMRLEQKIMVEFGRESKPGE